MIAATAVGAVMSYGAVSLPGEVSYISSIAPIALALGVPIAPLALLVAVEMVPDIFRTVGNVTLDVALTTVVDRGRRSSGKLNRLTTVRRFAGRPAAFVGMPTFGRARRRAARDLRLQRAQLDAATRGNPLRLPQHAPRRQKESDMVKPLVVIAAIVVASALIVPTVSAAPTRFRRTRRSKSQFA